MGFILKYGSYAHDEGEVEVEITKTPLYSQSELRIGYVEQWTIRGIKHAASVATLTTAIQAMESAYSVNYRDIILYESDGATTTAHGLTSALATSGVKVTGLRYPQGGQQEYTTFRTYEITVEAEFINTVTGLLDFSESLRFFGGGPRIAFLTCLSGPPIRQQTAQQTPYFCTQSGYAVGQLGYPPVPAAKFPNDQITKPEIERISPDRIRINRLEGYRISWTYQFGSANPFNGVPTLPIL